jgi:hypothetical protein
MEGMMSHVFTIALLGRSENEAKVLAHTFVQNGFRVIICKDNQEVVDVVSKKEIDIVCIRFPKDATSDPEESIILLLQGICELSILPIIIFGFEERRSISKQHLFRTGADSVLHEWSSSLLIEVIFHWQKRVQRKEKVVSANLSIKELLQQLAKRIAQEMLSGQSGKHDWSLVVKSLSGYVIKELLDRLREQGARSSDAKKRVTALFGKGNLLVSNNHTRFINSELSLAEASALELDK